MGNLSNFESNEKGKARMEQLRQHGAKADGIVRGMYALAVEYNNYRESIADDVEDVQYSDASLTYMIGQLKPIVDGLTPEQRQWLDLVMAQLGFSPTV